jgi:hypothetical protein
MTLEPAEEEPRASARPLAAAEIAEIVLDRDPIKTRGATSARTTSPALCGAPTKRSIPRSFERGPTQALMLTDRRGGWHDRNMGWVRQASTQLCQSESESCAPARFSP